MESDYKLFERLNKGNGPLTDEERFDQFIKRNGLKTSISPEEAFNMEMYKNFKEKL